MRLTLAGPCENCGATVTICAFPLTYRANDGFVLDRVHAAQRVKVLRCAECRERERLNKIDLEVKP